MLRLVFLGRLEDVAGGAEMALPCPASLPLAQVLAGLAPELRAALAGPRVKLALNGAILAAEAEPMLQDGDELAFLPPVSGG